ncbi:MAG: hypothetical protein J6U54_05905 [Clostridiales bacterium]|nr:hypothetical protein [Clostridiales bacterium]
MKRIGLHVTNWVGFVVANAQLGRLWGMLFGFLFRGFLTDEGYAAEHPKKYLLGAIGIVTLCVVSSFIVIYIPLNALCEFLDKKIDNLADEKEWD